MISIEQLTEKTLAGMFDHTNLKALFLSAT